MSAFARVRLPVVVAVFAAAYLCQPLALNACAVSCEAARAARTPALAAPCHHTTSCATQVSQPAAPGSTAVPAGLAPPPAVASSQAALPITAAPPLACARLAGAGPPSTTHLRL